MRIVRKALFRLGVVAFAATIACAAAPAADEAGLPIARGVRVGDVVLTGLTTQPARERLRRELARPLQVGNVAVSPSRFGLSVDVDAAARAALAAGPGESISLAASVDDARIRRFVARLAPRYFRAPVDARVAELDARLRPTLEEERPGRRLDRRALERAIRGALLRGERRPIGLRFTRVLPEVTRADLGAVIVIRRESNTLTLFDGRKQVRVFRVATGLPQYPTPLGRFDVVDKQYHPWWYPPPSDWAKGLKPVPPGPSNPLGTRWMGLSAWGVGIHGTPSAASIGYSASHGCIRMYVPDAEWLFERVDLGTPVFIVSA